LGSLQKQYNNDVEIKGSKSEQDFKALIASLESFPVKDLANTYAFHQFWTIKFAEKMIQDLYRSFAARLIWIDY
jgi:hypothetical protein